MSLTKAAKVLEEIYGKWRSLEFEIPIEAKEEKDNRSQNVHIQSFRDFFHKSTGSKITDQSRERGDTCLRNNSNMQIVVAPMK